MPSLAIPDPSSAGDNYTHFTYIPRVHVMEQAQVAWFRMCWITITFEPLCRNPLHCRWSACQRLLVSFQSSQIQDFLCRRHCCLVRRFDINLNAVSVFRRTEVEMMLKINIETLRAVLDRSDHDLAFKLQSIAALGMMHVLQTHQFSCMPVGCVNVSYPAQRGVHLRA